ncbi:MAG: hypothetical protein GXP47_14990 [Acidobacteria bacterium]|nr:hypothetical protein [Acidobacteriota bacterium]
MHSIGVHDAGKDRPLGIGWPALPVKGLFLAAMFWGGGSWLFNAGPAPAGGSSALPPPPPAAKTARSSPPRAARRPRGRILPAGTPGFASAFGIDAGAYTQEYDYFKVRMGFSDQDYWDWADIHFQELGAHWTRSNLQLVWDLVEPVIGGGYDWDNPMLTDEVVTHVYRAPGGVHWLGVFHEGTAHGDLRNPLDHPREYAAFVRAAVERYDGDGHDDVAPGVAVRYWQVGNEIPIWLNSGRDVDDYVSFLRLVRGAALAADPGAKLVLMAPTTTEVTDPFLLTVIARLAPAHELDVLDLHHWGPAGEWKMNALPAYRRLLDDLQLQGVQIWSCEHATWVGAPAGQPFQDERDQARSLVKRFVWNRAHGLDKLFWSQLMDRYRFEGNPGSIFNSLGLMSDGQNSGDPPERLDTERIAYWSYRLLAAHTDTPVATQSGEMSLTGGGLYGYGYRRRSDGRALHVLWHETSEVTVTLPAGTALVHVTNLITDRFGNTEEYDLAARDGQVTLTVGQDPLLVEEGTDARPAW